MPHVIVKLYPGESEEQKAKLAEELTKTITSVTGKPVAAVSIAIEEVAEDVWMDQVYANEIKPNLEKLYKKPGY